MFSFGGRGGAGGATAAGKGFAFDDGPPAVASPPSAQTSKPGRAKGRAKKNQDAALIVDSIGGSGVDLYCVFDGHGPNGEVVAQWLLANLPTAVQSALTGYESDLTKVRRLRFLFHHKPAGVAASLFIPPTSLRRFVSVSLPWQSRSCRYLTRPEGWYGRGGLCLEGGF